MANFYGIERTNYFKVTDKEKYNALFKRLCTDTGEQVLDFTKTDNEGNTVHGFGAYGCIEFGPENEDDEEYEYNMDSFYKQLKKILPKGETFIHVCTGSEKLRYLVTDVVAITRNEIKIFNAQKMAREWALEKTGVLPTEAKY